MRECCINGKKFDLDNPPVNSVVRTKSGRDAVIVDMADSSGKGLLWFDDTSKNWTVSKLLEQVETIVAPCGLNIEY